MALTDPVDQGVSGYRRGKPKTHAPVILKTQAVGLLSVIRDLFVMCRDNDGLFIVNLVLVNMFQSPQTKLFGAIEALDKQTGVFCFQPPHQFDTPPPAFVSALVCKMAVGFIVTVHAGT